MNIFTSKSKYELGMVKDTYEPIDLKAIYERVKKKREQERTV